MSYSFDSDSASSSTAPYFDSNGLGSNAENDLRKFVAEVETSAQFQTQVNTVSNICWDKCFPSGSYGYKMDDKKAQCIKNCTERYLEMAMHLQSKLQSSLQKHSSGM
ncbi:hypothetical protein Ciccas_007780 [Cichlidogyrus casuarinus]|uniref:Mitochondrial import inner membrane translocase subunit n=1 Tax=Cichlidogyrus casuarinus TaxID=1844966 RepID=A0ABD2Q235_9PLAT